MSPFSLHNLLARQYVAPTAQTSLRIARPGPSLPEIASKEIFFSPDHPDERCEQRTACRHLTKSKNDEDSRPTCLP